MLTWIDLLGYTAALCTTLAFIPQAVKVIRTQDTRALSLKMYIIFTIGVFLWLLYGIAHNDGAIILGNAIITPLAMIILVNKIRNDGL